MTDIAKMTEELAEAYDKCGLDEDAMMDALVALKERWGVDDATMSQVFTLHLKQFLEGRRRQLAIMRAEDTKPTGKVQ